MSRKADEDFKKHIGFENYYDAKRRKIERERTNLIKQNTEIKENTKKYTPAPGIPKVERMWKNHKWINRKRDINGKWVYDYGDGYGKGDRKTLRENEKRLSQLSKDERELRDLKKQEDEQFFNESKNPVEKFIDSIKKFKIEL